MPEIKTWGGKSTFSYTGSVERGAVIEFGGGYKAEISSQQFDSLLKQFKGKLVPCGTSRTNAPRDSLGEWLQQNVAKTALASYVGALLLEEGFATKRGTRIKFK